MRAFRAAGIALFVATASAAPAAPVDAEAPTDVAACMAACEATLDACRKQADVDAARCRDDAYDPCDVWCPCDQFMGHAQVACLLECDKCEAQAEQVAARCPDGSAAKAACAAEHRRCRTDCAESD